MNRRVTTLAIVCLLLALARPVEAMPVWVLEGADNRVFLVGSIHLLRESDYPMPATLTNAYEEAERLLMELDMDDIDSARAGAIMFARGTPPEGENLESLMGPEKFRQADALAAGLGMDLDRLQGAEPWYAALTLTQLQLMRRGYDPRFGLDSYLATKAASDGKPVDGLETFEEQILFFDSLPIGIQADMLLESLEEMSELEAAMEDTVRAWREGDADYLASELLEELRAYPELYDRLVVERNRRWLPRIMALRASDVDHLVVVGALHLVGEDGLLAMLEEEGISARPLVSASGLN